MKSCVDDGLDLLAQPLDRVAMDAREQRAVAPFARRRAGRERAAHGHAFGGELAPARRRSRRPAAPASRRALRGRPGPVPRSATRTISTSASSRVHARSREFRGRVDRRRERRALDTRLRTAAAARPRPRARASRSPRCRDVAAPTQRRVARRCAARASSSNAGHAAAARDLVRGDEPKTEQRVVHLVGASRRRATLPRARARSPRRRAGRASAAVASSSQRRAITACVRRSSSGASSRYAYGRAVRISSASGDGVGQVARDDRDVARLDAAQQPLEPVDVHRLVQAVVDRLRAPADGRESRARRRGSRRRRSDRGTPPPSGPRRASAAAAPAPSCRRESAAARATIPAIQRQRAREHRRVEHRLDQHVAHACSNAGSARRRRARSCGSSTATARSRPRWPPPAARS